ncbi:MAG: IS1/IS6 family transposase [Chloroflexi bacterium]|nr:IS1/IS6 family transposase [Chloroflexota bacterium]
MNPQEIFCPNLDCPARGQVGAGNISVHSQKEQRYECEVCGTTFAASQGTIFYRLKTEAQVVLIVLTLLAHGCPLQAIVAAYGFDERTVKSWWQRTGQHCQKVHDHTIGQSQLDLQQVQADEIKVKLQGGTVWMALAIMVSTRLWLGGVISTHRDKGLIQALADQIRRVALCRPLLLAVDGLPSYVKAFQRAFRSKVPRLGQPGRCHLWSWSDIAIVQVVKQRAAATLTIHRRIVQGSADLVERLIQASQGQGGINTAYIERLNATFRQSLAALARRTRALAQQPETLQAGMYVVGCIYNFCTYHHSLRVPLYLSQSRRRWLRRTPAIVAGLTDHCWTIQELFQFKVPPSPWTPPTRCGRPSRQTLRLVGQWCH